MPQTDVIRAFLTILNELLDGAASNGCVLNPEDPGLLHSLERLTAEQASAIPPGGAPIAAHVDHLRYGFELLNRWNAGEEPFEDANYSASWKLTTVSEPEWRALREALRREVYAWRTAIEQPARAVDEVQLTTVSSSIVHLAYHLGAIRQIDRSTRGPSAGD